MNWKILISGLATTVGIIGLARAYTAEGFLISLAVAVTGAIVLRRELDG